MADEKRPPSPPSGGLFSPRVFVWLFAIWVVVSIFRFVGLKYLGSEPISYSAFKTAVRAGEVQEVNVGSTVITGVLKPGAKIPSGDASEATPAPEPAPEPDGDAKKAEGVSFTTVPVPDEGLIAELEKHDVEVRGVPESGFGSDWVPAILMMVLFGALFVFLGRRMRHAQGGFMSVGKSKAKVYVEKEVDVTFDQVAGVDEAKEELREVIEFLKTPEKFGRLGGKMPKGILLAGPPGTGKTLLARAVAGEAGVPFFSISGSDFVEMFVGVGAARVRDLFNQAKAKAPAIVFIDELDAIGRARAMGPQTHEEREQTLNQLLVELDGFDTRSGVVLMAATNRPEILDPALLRAGRFDRQVVVDRPDRIGRKAILELHAKNVPLAADIDLDRIAAMTAGFAGADLANIVNEAALLAVRRGRDDVGPDEFLEAVERVVAGLERKNRVLNQEEKQRVAHHEVGHALMALSAEGADPVQKISIIPRGVAALGYTLQAPTEDRFLMTQAELEARIAVLLGGRVAEELVYGDVSTGAADDLRKATDIARNMVVQYGMSDTLGQVALSRDPGSMFLGMPNPGATEISEETAREVDEEVRRIISEQYAHTKKTLASRIGVLKSAASVLIEKETISGDELQSIAKGASEAA